MAHCPKCRGTGKVSSRQFSDEPNKVSTGWGTHRCDRCYGSGVVQGMGGGGAGQQLGTGLWVIFSGFFLHPVFSIFGFWLIATILLILMGHAGGVALGFDMEKPHGLFFFSGMVLGAGVTWTLRRYVHRLMKWTFFLLLGGIVLAITIAIIQAARGS